MYEWISLELPCGGAEPPPTPIGGSALFEIDTTLFSCPAGFEFDTRVYPHFRANCTSDKKWNPTDKLPDCVARRCAAEEPPLPYMNMDRDWRLRDRDLGALIAYTCPHLKSTLKDNVISKLQMHVYDSDSRLYRRAAWNYVGHIRASPNLMYVQFIYRSIRAMRLGRRYGWNEMVSSRHRTMPK